jgi:molybdopterin-guanine dinucleotide biosynthesis protein MobB
MSDFPLPLLGFAAYSGTGKTTLLTRLLPLLKQQGLRVGLVKHSHHNFEIDYPGKDSYELRKAGAGQVVIASPQRVAWIREVAEKREEPDLEEALSAFDSDSLDLILVEGFKHEAAIPKIELHRQALQKPFLYPQDSNIIAIAVDQHTPEETNNLSWLDLNNPPQIVDFIVNWLANHHENLTAS